MSAAPKDFTLAGYAEGGIIARTLFTARAAAFSPAPHWDQEPNPLRAECLDDARDVVKALTQGARQHAPGLLEEACEWMMARGYATGPGDTMSDLMTDLSHQVRERALKECATVAEGVRVNPRRTTDDSWREASALIVGRIRSIASRKASAKEASAERNARSELPSPPPLAEAGNAPSTMSDEHLARVIQLARLASLRWAGGSRVVSRGLHRDEKPRTGRAYKWHCIRQR